MENIKLELSVSDVNIILNALANRPYVEVAELIGKIQSEGNKQLSENIT
jgi:hypothetical protein